MTDCWVWLNANCDSLNILAVILGPGHNEFAEEEERTLTGLDRLAAMLLN